MHGEDVKTEFVQSIPDPVPTSSNIPSRTENTTQGAKPDNPIYGVGGTAKDGGASTAATVADGGPDDSEKDETYQPPK
ncbi:MAG: hypothetical protein Q9184_005847 [Pyrenodesmia sp. 2 TL-2023]